jgi:hypothetical protein
MSTLASTAATTAVAGETFLLCVVLIPATGKSRNV